MPRKLIAFLLSLYAILFAFGALTAVRWPSIMMMFTATLHEGAPSTGFENVNWRELGIVYGAPYFLAALCFYAAAVSVDRKTKGGFAWFAMGCAAGFPIAFLVDYAPSWWSNPTAGEGAVLGAAVGAALLGLAVWELRHRSPRPPETAEAKPAAPKAIRRPLFAPPAYGPVPAAVLAQRASFAREGAKMNIRRRRRLVW